MTRILVLYGTSEGHTEKVATAVADALAEIGCGTDIIEAGTVEPDIARYDGVLVAASVHAGAFQKRVVNCVRRNAAAIAARPNAFLPVCLAVLQKDDPKVSADLDAIVGRFSAASGWTPAMVRFVAGALPYTRYNFLKRWLMKRIVAKAGGDTDTSRDYVYTDWDELKVFARHFGRRVQITAA